MMSAAAKLLLGHHARRLRWHSRPLSVSTSSTAVIALAVGTPHDRTWPLGGAAGLAAVVGLAASASASADGDAVVRCEADASSWQSVPDGGGEAARKGKTLLQTLTPSELSASNPQDQDGGKSARAFTSALQNSLFNSYEDGADDWDEVEHTNRRAPAEGGEEEERQKGLLATSNVSDCEEVVLSAKEKEANRKVIVQRLKTVHGNDLGKNQVYTKNMYFYQSAQVKDYCFRRLRLFALPSSAQLGKEVACLLGTNLHSIDIGAFNDGETSVKINDMVRGKHVFVVCTTTSSNSIMELLLTVSAMRRGSAKRICVVIPYYGYSRQDRRIMREPIAAADMSILLEEMGVDSVICVDLHDPLLKGFFSPHVPVDHVTPGPVAAAYFYEQLFGTEEQQGNATEIGGTPKEEPKITIVAAHENQVFRANMFRNALEKLSGSNDIEVAMISNSKSLHVKRDSSSTALVGDVAGRKCIIVDDIINTGGTLRDAVERVDKSGASEIYAWATHGVLHRPGNDAPEKIQEMEALKYLLISNSVAVDRELPPKIRKLSIAPLLAESVARALDSESISSLMNVKAPESEK